MSKIEDLIHDLIFVVTEYIHQAVSIRTEYRDELKKQALAGDFTQLEIVINEHVKTTDRKNQLLFLKDKVKELLAAKNTKNWDSLNSSATSLLEILQKLLDGKAETYGTLILASLKVEQLSYNNRLSKLVKEQIIDKHRINDLLEIIKLYQKLESAHAGQQILVKKAGEGRQGQATITQLQSELTEAQNHVVLLDSERTNLLATLQAQQEKITALDTLEKQLAAELIETKNKNTAQEAELSRLFLEVKQLRQELKTVSHANKDHTTKLDLYLALFTAAIRTKQPLMLVHDKEEIKQQHVKIVFQLEDILKKHPFSQLFSGNSDHQLKNKLNEQLKFLLNFLDATGDKELLIDTYGFSKEFDLNADNGSQVANLTLLDYIATLLKKNCSNTYPEWLHKDVSSRFKKYFTNGFVRTPYGEQLRLFKQVQELSAHSSESTKGSTASATSVDLGNSGPSCPNN